MTTNTAGFPQALSLGVQAVWVLVGGVLVVGGTVDLGTFVALLGIFRSVGAESPGGQQQ